MIFYAGLFVFVFLFIVVFRPFQIEKISGDNMFYIATLYAIVASVMPMLVLETVSRYNQNYFSEKKWTLGRELLLTQICLIAVVFGNYFVGRNIEFYGVSPNDIVFTDLWNDFIHTYTIGFFPVVSLIIVNYIFQLKRNLSHAQKNNSLLGDKRAAEKATNVVIKGPSNKEDIAFAIHEFLFAMSDGNYVEFHLWDQSAQQIRREIKRNSLSNIESQLENHDQIFRSHRTYIVNIDHVVNSNGNAQGYQLDLKYSDVKVPVSRRKLVAFDNLING